MINKTQIYLEYQKAQDSAEYYNTMIWTLVSLVLGFSISIFYLVLKDNVEKLGDPTSIILLGAGSLVLVCFSILVEGANDKKILKYSICKEIENKLGFIGQNLLTAHKNIFTTGLGMKNLRRGKLLLLVLYFIFQIGALLMVCLKPINFITKISKVGIISILIGSILFFILEIFYLRKDRGIENLVKINVERVFR